MHWQQANALALPFGEHEFDCAICQFGVMFFADKRAAFRETFRVLKARRPVPVHCLGSRRGGRHPIRRSRGHRAPAVARPGIAASAALFRPYRRARRPRGGRLWRRIRREIARALAGKIATRSGDRQLSRRNSTHPYRTARTGPPRRDHQCGRRCSGGEIRCRTHRRSDASHFVHRLTVIFRRGKKIEPVIPKNARGVSTSLPAEHTRQAGPQPPARCSVLTGHGFVEIGFVPPAAEIARCLVTRPRSAY